jgi:aspartate carbamoyltransferase catalytic subunit
MDRHIIKTQNFTREFLAEIYKLADKMRECVRTGGNNELEGKIVATLFYEESLRTRHSFEAAAARLGARVISSANARKFSSAAKGEILEDAIKVLSTYVDCIVLRYHEEGGAARAAHASSVPIINGGDGSGQHPTQALLDMYTIYNELGTIDGLTVALVGDLKYGRTVHSLAYLLGKYDNVKMFLISPLNSRMPEDILDYLHRHGVHVIHNDDLNKHIDTFDVLYQTRIQRERFNSPDEYEKAKGKLIITRNLANSMMMDAIIMHPLPRIDEIRYSVDDNHRAKYFKQAENGLYVRMALLKMLLGG